VRPDASFGAGSSFDVVAFRQAKRDAEGWDVE